MAVRSSSTVLPPLRRVRRRDWGRMIARVLCVLFALSGLVPVGIGLLVRTRWARGIATAETKKAVAALGIEVDFDLEIHLWPLSVGTRDLRVAASDGQGPFLTARRAAARPKIFGLLAGKLLIDEIEIEAPKARVVVRDGKLANLALPEQKKSSGGTSRAPFSVVSASEAELDLDIDGVRLLAHEIDADVTTDIDGDGKDAFEVALRVAEAKSTFVRALSA